MSTTPGAPSPSLTFEVIGSSESTLTLSDFRLIVAGYTGRDEAAVQEHIRELAAIGVPAPDSVPTFYDLDPALATQAAAVTVEGGNTSGEVEPVLVRAGGRLYLGVGSDHTDRDIERDSVELSKAACVKPLSRSLIELPAGLDWDSVGAQSTVDGRQYQQGSLRSLRIPTDVLALFDERSGDTVGDLVMFGGTLPVIGGEFIPGSDWSVLLALPGGELIDHSYRVTSGVKKESAER